MWKGKYRLIDWLIYNVNTSWNYNSDYWCVKIVQIFDVNADLHISTRRKKSNNNSKEINKKKYINLIWDSKLGEEKIKVHSRKPIFVAWEVLIHGKLLTLTFNLVSSRHCFRMQLLKSRQDEN